jgi:hypothetical protein
MLNYRPVQRRDDGGAQQGVTGKTLRAVTRPEFPNRCSFATIFDSGICVRCGCSVSDVTGDDREAQM